MKYRYLIGLIYIRPLPFNAALCICFLLPPVFCCCPCDSRYVYIAPNGIAYAPTGNVAPPRMCEHSEQCYA